MPVKKVLSNKSGRPMAALTPKTHKPKLGRVKRLAKTAKPASLGAAAVVTTPPCKPREQLGAVDKVLVELQSSVYRDLTSLLETFRRKLKAIRLLLKK